MLLELARILRPNGFLIMRENDCEQGHSLTAKYLNFIQAIRILEGAHVHFNGRTQCDGDRQKPNVATSSDDWEKKNSTSSNRQNCINIAAGKNGGKDWKNVASILKLHWIIVVTTSQKSSSIFFNLDKSDALTANRTISVSIDY